MIGLGERHVVFHSRDIVKYVTIGHGDVEVTVSIKILYRKAKTKRWKGCFPEPKLERVIQKETGRHRAVQVNWFKGEVGNEYLKSPIAIEVGQLEQNVKFFDKGPLPQTHVERLEAVFGRVAEAVGN